MSGFEGFPPPGGGYPAPGSQPTPAGQPPPPPGPPDPRAAHPAYSPGLPTYVGAAHKPGAIPLRPLGLGDLYDAAFKIIRFNPRATVGSAVIVSSVAMLIPVLVTGILSLTVGLSLQALDEGDQAGTAEIAGLIGAYGALVVALLLQWVGMVMVTGMNAHVAAGAALGRQLGLGEAWAATRGKRWRLVGMMVAILLATLLYLAVLVGIVIVLVAALGTAAAVVTSIAVVLVGLAGLVFLWTRLAYLAVPPLMLEPVGVFAALGRSWALTSRQFWRTLGIGVLTSVGAGIVGGIISAPLSIAAQVVVLVDPGGTGLFWYVVCLALGQVLSSALSSPFITTVSSLQYLDQRIRKEAYDVELMTRAGIIAP
ncbi:glycerophosphoryl diester phosphodiesterase membrane domain-containing protein [Nocardioides sp.]|uniref:glycerophosphoryl diester phosphodiesterase membrane domain-containing protein n=1 Tax=Nocardioides sp. TaxID=35761 RepID=UPI003D113ADB